MTTNNDPLKPFMLTDEERQNLESCRTIGGYDGKCDPNDTICRGCLHRERAAIAKAVRVLGEAICADCGEGERFVASCDKCPLKPLLKEAQK
jgi:superfamily II helicase